MLPRSASEQYQRQQAIATTATGAVAKLWRRMGDDFDSSYELIRPQLLTLVDAARAATVSVAGSYTSAVLAETGQEDAPTGELALGRFLDSTPDGRTVGGLVDESVIRAKVGVAGGMTAGEALLSAGSFLSGAMLTLLADTRRDVYAADIIQRPTLTGYTRMLNPPSCSRCAILAGKWFRWNTGFQRHPRCDCMHIPARENLAGDLTTDPYEYFNSLPREEQDKLFRPSLGRALEQRAEAARIGARNAQAIRDGGDIYRVENIRLRGLATSKQAVRYGTPTKFTIDDIYRLAGTDRKLAIEMMQREGYITGPQIGGGNIVGRYREAYQKPISRPIVPGSKRDRVLRARATGVRDPLDRATMTAAERRLFDASYRLQYAKKYGYLPRSIGQNSADLYSGLVGQKLTPERLARLEADLQRQLAKIPAGKSGMRSLADALLGKDDFEAAQIFDSIEKSVGTDAIKRAARTAGAGSGGRVPPRIYNGSGTPEEPDFDTPEGKRYWRDRQDALPSNRIQDNLYPHEIKFYEELAAAGEEFRLIPRGSFALHPDGREHRTPTPDVEIVRLGLRLEAKSMLSPSYGGFAQHIADAVASARAWENAAYAKENFILYSRKYRISDKVVVNLAKFNLRRSNSQIQRLFVWRDGRIEEIDLQ